jgi:SAM-dependent methyltransferase
VTRAKAAVAAPLSPRAALRWPLIKRAMKECTPASTLEIGCGQGSMGARLVGLTGSFTAVEPDEGSCAVARGRIESRGGTVVNGRSADLAAGRAFDMVCAFEVLEHLQDDEGALQEWKSLIKPSGHVLVSVPAWQHMFGPWDKAVGHYRRYSPEQLSDLFRAAGYQPVRVGLYGWPLAFALEAIRNRVATGEPRAEDSAAEQTARSGRWLQPTKKASQVAVDIGILPFQGLQRLVPSKGNGIVALARRI